MSSPPQLLDLAHLSRQTAGDVKLALDLLTLFETQSRDALDDLDLGAREADRVVELAHRLNGAARTVGADRVADAAAAVEAAASRGAAEDQFMDDLCGLSVALALTLGALAVVLRHGALDVATGLESFKTAR